MKIKTSLCAGAALGVFAIAGAAAAQDTTTAWKGAPQWTNDDVQFKVRGRVLLDTVFDPGPETIEARLFRRDEIPWHDLAFRTVKVTLERYFEDREQGQFGLHCADIA